MSLTERFYIANWLVEPSTHRLIGRQGTVSLQPRVMQVLLCLARHAGETVSYDQLIEEVWSDDDVMDHVLHQAISKLRKALSHGVGPTTLIETIPKRGYRLTVGVRPAAPSEPARRATEVQRDPSAVDPHPSVRLLPAAAKRARRWYLLAVGCVLLLVGGLYGLNEERTLPSLLTRPLTARPGFEYDPAFSPDGEQIAFVWADEAGQADVYVQPVGAGVPGRLTDTPASEIDPTWSPDGPLPRVLCV